MSMCLWHAEHHALYATKNFYACRRSRVQAQSNFGTGDQGSRCTTSMQAAPCTYFTRRQLINQVPKNRELNRQPPACEAEA